jgi:hypothetical protein
MTPTAFLRTAFAIPIVLLIGCATPAASTGSEPQETHPGVHTLVLAQGQQTVIASESLTVKLAEINDSRCPAKVTCVWAGHAAVALQVSKPGSPVGSVSIGTEAPPNMNLPHDGSYGGYLFQLVRLEPGNADGSTSPASTQRATIKVSRLQGQ